MPTTTNETVFFGNRKIGETFQIDVGGGNWIVVTKTNQFEAVKENGYKIGVSVWTKTR